MFNRIPLKILGMTLVCFSICLNCASALANDSTVSGSIGIRLVQIPDTVKSDSRSAYYIVASLVPNEVFSQQIEVSNSTTAPANIDIYPAAATNVDGAFLPAGGQTANDLTSWTKVTPSTLLLASNSSAIVTVTITVPAQVINGEKFGVIWASDTGTPNSAGITSTNRVGIRMYDTVGPPVVSLKENGSSFPVFGGVQSSTLYLTVTGIFLSFFLIILYRNRIRRNKSQKIAFDSIKSMWP